MKTASKYERGDRVVSIASWSRRTAGTVSRAGRGVSVMVRWDGGNNDERVFLNNIRIETPDDVAKREHEAALRAKTPAEMRQAADDLSALADWFEARPAVVVVALECGLGALP